MERFSNKTDVYYKTGSLKYLTTLEKEKAFVITDPFMVEFGMTDQLLNILKTSVPEYEVFSDIKPDPPIEIVSEGVRQMLNFKPDVVIALGGGSTIDAAKSIMMFSNLLQGNVHKPQLIAIPTTSGTGSEVTSFSVITVGDKKIPLVDDFLIPDVAILDPIFVKTVPPQITADTAIDTLTHAIEAYVSTSASDYTDALAEKSIKLVFDHLLNAYNDGSDMNAREKLHNASCIAGMAFTNAYLGINHSLAHALGGGFHIPHGRANAILLPYVIRYNASLENEIETETARRYAELASILKLPAASTKEGVNSLICAIEVLLRETNTPLHLNEMNIERAAFENKVENMSQTALKDKCTATNPRNPTKEELVTLYMQAYGE